MTGRTMDNISYDSEKQFKLHQHILLITTIIIQFFVYLFTCLHNSPKATKVAWNIYTPIAYNLYSNMKKEPL
jgi:hypothetical protein